MALAGVTTNPTPGKLQPYFGNPATLTKPGLPAGGTAADTSLLRGTAADILGLQSQAEIDAANAQASQIQAQGYQAENAAYTTVGDIASQNAVVAGSQAGNCCAGRAIESKLIGSAGIDCS